MRSQGFEYSDDEGNELGSADVENMYYTAKGELHVLTCVLSLEFV